MGFIFGSGTKAAKIQAQATMDSANMQANSDRLVAQAAQSSQETMLAQKRAADQAAELLSVPQEQVDVQLAGNSPAAQIDENTGRRKTARSPFMGAKPSTSGVRI